MSTWRYIGDTRGLQMFSRLFRNAAYKERVKGRGDRREESLLSRCQQVGNRNARKPGDRRGGAACLRSTKGKVPIWSTRSYPQIPSHIAPSTFSIY